MHNDNFPQEWDVYLIWSVLKTWRYEELGYQQRWKCPISVGEDRGDAGPPTPGVQPPTPAQFFPPYPRPLFFFFFSGYPRPKFWFFSPAPCPSDPHPPPIFRQKSPYPTPPTPDPPVIPHISPGISPSQQQTVFLLRIFLLLMCIEVRFNVYAFCTESDIHCCNW